MSIIVLGPVPGPSSITESDDQFSFNQHRLSTYVKSPKGIVAMRAALKAIVLFYRISAVSLSGGVSVCRCRDIRTRRIENIPTRYQLDRVIYYAETMTQKPAVKQGQWFRK
jgi:hypothetical protein